MGEVCTSSSGVDGWERLLLVEATVATLLYSINFISQREPNTYYSSLRQRRWALLNTIE